MIKFIKHKVSIFYGVILVGLITSVVIGTGALAASPSPSASPTPQVHGFGQGNGTSQCDGVKTSLNFGCQGTSLQENPVLGLLYAVIRFLTAGVGIVVIISVVIGGVQYTMSRGDPSATAAAVTRITNSAIALLVYIFAFAIINYFVPGGVLK